MYLIGILGRSYYNKDNQCIIQTNDYLRKYLCRRDDVCCITLLPNSKDLLSEKDDEVDKRIDYILDKCDAFIVPGGSKALKLDEYIVNYAIEKNKPLLAICLGFQLLCSIFACNRNKFFMTRRSDLPLHCGDRYDYSHKVKIKDNTLLKSIINKDEIKVNSVHHDTVDFEMNNLVINAISEDGIIEGVEYPKKKFIMGLQWHPEYIIDKNSIEILDNFIDSIKK